MFIHIYGCPYMNIDSLKLFKCLSDETRLLCILLIQQERELCVCELTVALQVSQPKISRHLSQLRACGLLTDRREGQWVYYQMNSSLPLWVSHVISTTLDNSQKQVKPLLQRLSKMGDRPVRKSQCC